jgi:hypothetical protein
LFAELLERVGDGQKAFAMGWWARHRDGIYAAAAAAASASPAWMQPRFIWIIVHDWGRNDYLIWTLFCVGCEYSEEIKRVLLTL